MQYSRRPRFTNGFAALVLLLGAAAAARADEVQLEGGAVIEGRATREGDSVVVQMESGQIRVSADSVKSIKKAESSDEVAQKRRAALAAHDVKGRIELARYCREHDLRATERALLEEVISLEPNQPEARRLLGYVKTDKGWEDRTAQEQRARDAEHEAWLARAHEREARDDAERDRARASQAARQRELEDEQLRNAPLRDDSYVYPYTYGYGYAPLRTYPARREPVRRDVPAAAERCLPGGCAAAPPTAQPVSPIAGTRHPRDTTWAVPGVRNPREWTR